MATGQQVRTTKEHGTTEVKWAAVTNDQLAPMPRRHMKAREILHQTGFDPSLILVRDFDSPNDTGFDPEADVDLGQGNVFRAVSGCQISMEVHCKLPAKLAYVLDDDWELTIQPYQTGETLRRLLDVPEEADLLRDHESPVDEPIEDDESIAFSDGPVFTAHIAESRRKIDIIVNGQQKFVTKRNLSFEELVVIAYGSDDAGPNITYSITFERGPQANPEGTLVAREFIKVRKGMVFNVQRTDKS